MLAFYDEELISIGEDTLTLAIDFRALDLAEHLIGDAGTITPVTEIVAMLFADHPPRSVLGKLLWALLRRHHETISLDMAAGLMLGGHAGHLTVAMRSLLVRAMNFGDVKAKDENPRKRRGASAIS
jgi:hypothetical protein